MKSYFKLPSVDTVVIPDVKKPPSICPTEFDESKMQFLIDSIDNMKKGNFIQSCSGTHYDHPVDSIFFIESNSVKFQYVSTFNTPLSLNDNTIMKMGRLNFNAMKMIYSIYSQR